MALVDDDIIILDDDMDGADVFPHDSKTTCPLLSPEINGRKGEESKRKAGSMRAENAKLFEEFVDYCTSLTQEHPEVITFLRDRLSKASPHFLSSVEFHNILGRCLTRVQNKRTKVYVYINELCTVLKANSSKRKIELKSPVRHKTPTENKKGGNREEAETKEEEASTSKKSASKAQIRYLENLLHTFSREIQKLQEKELSLEELEDEDSSYIQESRLKRKLLRIFQKLCQLKGCSNLTGRVIEQKITYCGTRYPEVNRRLQKFINETSDGFPDYGDVLRVIQKANEKHRLSLGPKQMEGMAQDAFRELGNRLQERRHLDLVFNFGSHLTDPYKPGFDPALQDASLARRLRDNRSVALSQLDNVIKKYADMQDEGEGEESRKIKLENESPRSSKREQNSWARGRKVSSPSSQESEEDESDDSETDIEDELKQCEQLSDEEEGAIDAEPPPVDPDNGVDPDIEPATESSSSAEEDKEDEREENEDKIQHGEDKEEADTKEESKQKDVLVEAVVNEYEENNESLMQTATQPALLSSHEEMSTIQERKQVLHPLHTSSCLPNQSQSNLMLSTIELQNNVRECGIQENSFSEKTGNYFDLPENENSQAQPVEKEELPHVPNNVMSNVHEEVPSSATDNTAIMERTDTPTNRSPLDSSLQSDLSNLPKNMQDNFVPESKIRLKSVTLDKHTPLQIQNTEVDATVAEQVLECAAGLGTCIGNINSNKPSKKCHSSDGPVEHHEPESKNGENENDAVCFLEMTLPKSCVSEEAQANMELLYGDISDEADICKVSDVSHLSSKNGMSHVNMQKETAKCLQSGTVGVIGPFNDSMENVKSKGASFTSKKRKKSMTQTSLKNGDGSYSGAEEEGNKMKRSRKSRNFDLESSSHSSPEISLDLIVNCSPPESPSPVSYQCIKSHASTQCDPDEVIVLSD